MHDIHDPPTQREMYDPDILANARVILEACCTPQKMQEAVLAAVSRNADNPEDWDRSGGLCMGQSTSPALVWASPRWEPSLTSLRTSWSNGQRQRT
jgi:hypothetical protein